MQRRIFAQQLMMLIRKSGFRQIEIASKIGISSAAISQFVHGTTLPTLRHMEMIFNTLKVPVKTRNQMQYQLMLARSEPRYTGKKNNGITLMPLRASMGLSIDEVAARTDMTVERLTEIENAGISVATEEEKNKLSEIYNVNFEKEEIAVAESGDINSLYQRGGAPQIMVSDLVEYDGEEKISEFAWRNIRNFISHTVSGVSKPVVAQAYSSEVGFLHDGLLQIVLSDTRPTGYATMELRMYEGGIFRLWQPGNTPEKNDNVPSFETHGNLLWSLPVVEVILQPLKVKVK